MSSALRSPTLVPYESAPSAGDWPRELLPGAGPRRVLFISYPFPPVGGAGVQRTVKFVKYLPAWGWQASVLTAANPSVPLRDESLVADVPAATVVRRARTWEPGYALKSAISAGSERSGGGPSAVGRALRRGARALANLVLQPDPQVLWLPAAVRAGRQVLREVPHDAIVATGPPFSTFLVGAALSRFSGLPLVLDYRDEWGISNSYSENKRPDPLSRWLQGRMERSVVRRAGALLATTRRSASSLDDLRDRAGSRARVEWIYNGFDPDDFPAASAAVPPRSSDRPYRLAYVGTLWNLTSAEPLVGAVTRLAQTDPALAGRLELVMVGRRTAAEEQTLGRLSALPCRVTTHPYLDHSAAVELLRSADGLCLLLADRPGADRVVPAKLFEYVAAGRPIVAIAPRGEVWDILRTHPRASLLRPEDEAGIAACLAREVRALGPGRPPAPWDASPYSRPHQAGQLAALLSGLAGGR